MSDEIKRIDIREFRRLGFIQEINRRILHPTGLAMEFVIEEDGRERLGGVWDYRDDPEGMAYGDNTIKQCKIDMVNYMIDEKAKYRKENLGFVIQEAEDQIPHERE